MDTAHIQDDPLVSVSIHIHARKMSTHRYESLATDSEDGKDLMQYCEETSSDDPEKQACHGSARKDSMALVFWIAINILATIGIVRQFTATLEKFTKQSCRSLRTKPFSLMQICVVRSYPLLASIFSSHSRLYI